VTADAGGFAERGVHTMRGSEVTPFPTPNLARMRCRRCRRLGVTVTAMDADDHLFGWCCLAEAVADGLCLPTRKAPSPALKRGRKS
jgi:hypothetical protein